jgi:hypothetical protein
MGRNTAGKARVLMMISLALLLIWVIYTLDATSKFQTAASVDPLAMVHVLFPWFWVQLLALALVGLATSRLAADTRWLHIFVLCQVSLYLYFTPFLLSGFSWSPDSLWHGGIAGFMPEILTGSKPAFSSYAESYPFSFITTYCVEQVSGLDVFAYTLFVYPVICIITLTVLIYAFASRLLNPKQAFVSMLVALPALHFIEPHVSPFSAGTVLTLVSLVLLITARRSARILSFFVILALVLTHPISPVSYGIFIVATGFFSILSKRISVSESFPFDTSVLPSVLFFLGIVWFAWTMYQVMAISETVEYAILDIVTLQFVNRLGNVLGWTAGAGGGSFIYSEIHQLNLGIYVVFLFFVSVLLLVDVMRRLARKNDVAANHTGHKRMTFVAFSSILYAGFGYMLFLATDQRFLLGRGLLFYIIMASIYISSHLVRQNQKYGIFKGFVVVSLILFLFVSFPLISYSKEAYNTFTPSAARGLTFVSGIDLSKHSISTSFDQQLAAYVDLSEGVLAERYPPLLNVTTAEFIVLRINSFFYNAMRSSLSFERNRYTELRDSLREDTRYNLIYSSPTFEVYSSSRG